MCAEDVHVTICVGHKEVDAHWTKVHLRRVQRQTRLMNL